MTLGTVRCLNVTHGRTAISFVEQLSAVFSFQYQDKGGNVYLARKWKPSHAPEDMGIQHRSFYGTEGWSNLNRGKSKEPSQRVRDVSATHKAYFEDGWGFLLKLCLRERCPSNKKHVFLNTLKVSKHRGETPERKMKETASNSFVSSRHWENNLQRRIDN